MKKPNILVTNDDGIFAPGIAAIIEVVKEIGTPYVFAPDSPQSGQGHAITLNDPLRVRQVDEFEGITAYECSGTPVDCVKLAKNKIYKDIDFDLCVSGINHGSNAAINIIYSGTMSAAMEASMENIPSIGFSLDDISFTADFTAAKVYAKKIINHCLNHDFGACKLLNVNIPALPEHEIKGIKVCKQGEATWEEEFIEAKDPRGKSYYWMTGKFVVTEQEEDSDVFALENHFISVVPSGHDLTHYEGIPNFKSLENL